MKFDSKEEEYFSWYLEELKENGYINHWEKIERSYSLTKGLIHTYIKPMKRVPDKKIEQVIIPPSSYTPDFKIEWSPKALEIFVQQPNLSPKKITAPFLCNSEGISIIEIKGEWDQNNMTRLAKNNIKFVHQRFGIVINLSKIPALFKNTFTPERYFNTDKTNKPRKLKYDPKRLRDFVLSVQK